MAKLSNQDLMDLAKKGIVTFKGLIELGVDGNTDLSLEIEGKRYISVFTPPRAKAVLTIQTDKEVTSQFMVSGVGQYVENCKVTIELLPVIELHWDAAPRGKFTPRQIVLKFI